jgi:alkylation response protein AidB-like acyl-CoA dehydrogenase
MKQGDFLEVAKQLSQRFAKRAEEVDQTGRFPKENFAELKERGFLGFTLAKEFGGQARSLPELIELLECIGEGDASTALSLGWHLGITMELRVTRPWSDEILAEVCKEIVREHKLINRLGTEPSSGSPTRGGKPRTVAQKSGEKWLITGHKSYCSMSYALDLMLVTAVMEETGEVGEFLVRKESPGIRVQETWDVLGMRGTASHDLLFEQTPAILLRRMDYKKRQTASKGWLLHIPATYLGVAKAARRYAVKFAASYTPSSLEEPIKKLPHIEQMIGEMELKYFTARRVLLSVAEQWDRASEEEKAQLAPELAAAKSIVTNSALQIVDLAMRIVGGHSLYRNTPLERYYRDVRGGLHNPPMDDMAIRMMANKAFLINE